MKLLKFVAPVEPVEDMKWLRGGRSAGVANIVTLGIVLVGLVGLGALISWTAAAPSPPSQKVLPPFTSAQPTQPAQQRDTGDTGAVVMVSGRDDHGLVQEPMVSLLGAPDDTTVVARVADGSFVRVIEQRGEWLCVQLIASPQSVVPQSMGWVNDYYLRSRMLRTDGGGQVDLVDARVVSDQVWVAVRPAGDTAATLEWLNPVVLQEIGAPINR